VSRAERKWDHIRLALETRESVNETFSDLQFIHQSLPDLSVRDVRIDHIIGELSLSSPIFINAMTGGGGKKTHAINQGMAIVARSTGVAMAVGSQMAALKDNSERYTYEIVRKENPYGIILANIGGEATVSQAQAAVDMLEANALQIHLNVIQELTMPEGDRDFSGTLKRIEAIVKTINVPVIVKETGFGMSQETVKLLASVGVSTVDVGGFGGTNFAKIENQRREKDIPYFNQWGIPTAISIVEAKNAKGQVSVIGSGGVSTALDVAKGIALGADGIGIAGTLLKVLINDGIETLKDKIEALHNELKMVMTALGASNISDLQKAPIMIYGNTFHWLEQRGINTKKYSQRTIK
jgi:isopentenyl-diphosphate delta-isomerase